MLQNHSNNALSNVKPAPVKNLIVPPVVSENTGYQISQNANANPVIMIILIPYTIVKCVLYIAENGKKKYIIIINIFLISFYE